MKINGNSIKIGNIIEHKDRLWVATKTQHTQPGKGGAYLQVELKDVKTGTKLNERFRSSESVELVRLEEKPYQFLFQEGDKLTVMDSETYDQITIPSSYLGESLPFLQDGMTITIKSYQDETIHANLPETIIAVIQEADPVIKGQTASSSFKPAVLDNGVRIMVPPHITSGTKVVVNTADATYVEKAKD